MNASLPTLPIPTTGADTATLPQGDISINQQLESSSEGFGPLLQQAVGALGEQFAVPAETLEITELLPEQLQGLPHGGKLLPLLQQVLDAAVAEGTDANTVFKDIAAKLEQLSVDTDLDPAQAVATAIQQFIDDTPRIAASVDTGLLRDIAGNSTLTPVGDAGVRSHTDVLQRLLPATAVHGNASTRMPEPTIDDPATRSMTGMNKLAGEMVPITPDQRDAAMSEAIAVFRRLATGSKASGAPEMLQRSDNVLTALGSITTPTPTAATAAVAQAAPAPTGFSLNVPVNQAGWDKALGERIQWMAGQGIQGANIKLNPAHLGPMEVRIQVQNDQASVHFTSAHGVVREALEAALPRLRDMFDSAGVELTDVDVSGHSFAEQQQAATDGQGATGNSSQNALTAADEDVDIVLETPVYSLLESGRLDLFA